MFNETEIKKDLYKSKAMAKLSHYKSGNLYYNVEVFGEEYQFPISTIEERLIHEGSMREIESIKLSEDLGETEFKAEIKGSELARWISKAIKNDKFKKLG